MSAPANCQLVGRWRIVEADIWDRDYLDLCGPATITITDHGRGEIAFGAHAGHPRHRIQPVFGRIHLGGFRRNGRSLAATAPPNCSTTARSRSNSPITTATKPSSKRNQTFFNSLLGGGRLCAGQRLEVEDAEVRDVRSGEIPCPVWSRPRAEIKVVLGPQERFFLLAAVDLLLSRPYALTDAYDRMGVHLAGPPLPLSATLDMPSEPIARGSIQVSGDGVATVLMSDHQTTGGYPKIATVVSSQLDGLAPQRSRSQITFASVTPATAVESARIRHRLQQDFLANLRAKPAPLAQRLMAANLIDGVVSGAERH